MNTINSSIHIIPSGEDNYIYLLVDNNKDAVVIDPGRAKPVLSILEKQNLQLAHILLTHYHADHTGGAVSLKSVYDCPAIGPDELTDEFSVLNFSDFSIRVILTPGHTQSGACYVLESTGKSAAVFTCDTMFIGGCGRCFGGEFQQMYQSLQKIAALPDDTLVYPGHDYTRENYQFALTVEPDNAVLRQRLAELEDKGSLDAVPSTIRLEKQTNPFLRTQSISIRRTLKMPDAPDWKVFAELRKRKDYFYTLQGNKCPRVKL